MSDPWLAANIADSTAGDFRTALVDLDALNDWHDVLIAGERTQTLYRCDEKPRIAG